MNKFFGLMLALMLGCVMPTHAQYSQNPDADYVQINAEGWLFCPVTDTQSVLGFLAVVDDAPTAGLNIQILWYEREPDGTWSTWGWQDAQYGEAVWWVRSHLNDVSALTLDIELNDAASSLDAGSAVDPAPLESGLFLDDPFQPVVQQAEDPTALVDVLATAGWQTAPGMSAVAVGDPIPCDGQSVDAVQYMLDDLASEVEIAYFGESSTSSSCSWPCKCTKTWKPMKYGNWVFVRSYVQGSIKHCVWTRTRSRDWVKSGLTWYLCNPCGDSGTKDDYSDQEKITQVEVWQPCEEPVDDV